MNLRKSTLYALYAVIELARSGSGTVTAAQVAARYDVPGPALAKAFQRLVRIGVVTGLRGTNGGYQLARDPAGVTLLEIVDAFQPPARGAAPAAGSTAGDDRALADRELRRVLDEVDEQSRNTLASITLGTLVSRRGLRAVEG